MPDTEIVKRVPVERNRGGQWVRFGDEEYRVPPLGFAALRDLQGEIESLKGIKGLPTAGQIDMVVRLFHEALKRNYPSMAAETVADMVDVGNYAAVLSAVMSISGYRRSEPGEALAQSIPSTGTASTAP